MSNEWRIFGPPGTGKTTYLSDQIAKAAEARGADTILVASFTKAAATELTKRRLPIPRDRVGTLHSHCYRAIGSPPLVDEKIAEWNAANPGLALGIQGFDVDEQGTEQFANSPGDEIYGQYQIAKAAMLDRDFWSPRVAQFALLWEEWKSEAGLIDFTDMIQIAHDTVDEAPGAPKVGFFDEVQDFTPLELALVRKWGSRMEQILLAGDDDQCIYGFKGATPQAFLNPPVDEDHKRILSQSHRLPRAVKDLATRWIEQLDDRQTKQFDPRRSVLDKTIVEGEVLRVPIRRVYPEDMVSMIEQDLAAEKSVMILTACGYMLEQTLAVLRKRAIPFHNPYRKKRGDWNPMRSGKNSASARVLAFLRPDVRTWQRENRFWTWQDFFQWIEPLRATLFRHGCKTRVEKIVAEIKARGEKPATFDVDQFEFEGEPPPEETEGSVTPGTLRDLFVNGDDFNAACSGDIDWYRNNLIDTKRKPMAYPMAIAEKHGGHSLKREPSVVIGTIHSVKGAQADHVYLFPDLPPMAYDEWMLHKVGRGSIVRQFYVGATRAREKLIIGERSSNAAVEL